MRWLLFLSRLAFICGFFFLLSLSLLIRDWAKDDAIVSTIAILGQVMGIVLIPAVNICYLVVLFWKRRLTAFVPLWLVLANILFLFIAILYLTLNNG